MTADGERARQLYRFLTNGAPESDAVFLVIPGKPPSKARPRVGKGGRVYTPDESRDAEERTGWYLRKVLAGRKFTGGVALGCIFYRPTRHRIDADNMLKHVCDAANGIAWVDDYQVTAVLGIVELDPANPRTVIVMGEHRSSLLRGDDNVRACEQCGKDFQLDPKGNPSRRFCSYECNLSARGHALKVKPVSCRHCGEPFVRTTSAQELCSPECRLASLRGKRKRAASERPMSCCSECGKQLTHRRGGRCRDCWRANPHPSLANGTMGR